MILEFIVYTLLHRIMNKITHYINVIKVWWSTRRSDLFDHTRERYTFYAPTNMKFDHRAVAYLREMQLQHWNPGELDFSRDMDDFDQLPEPLKETLEKLLAFFAFGDGVVDEVIDTVKSRITIPEVRAFYLAQEESEIVHGQTYGDMLQVLVPSHSRRDAILRDIGSIAQLDRKLKWVKKWTNKRLPLAVLVCAMLMIEQMWFSTAFNIINWMRVINRMPELVKANEFIIRNENLHGEYASYILLNYFDFCTNTPLKRIFQQMLDEAKAAEVAFIHAITNRFTHEEDELYRGLKFGVLYDHLMVTISTIKNSLLMPTTHTMEETTTLMGEEVGCEELSNNENYESANDEENELPLPILTALGVGKDNFFEYSAPNYQNAVASEDSIDNVISNAFKD